LPRKLCNDEPVIFTATVMPSDGDRSVSFLINGTVISGCGDQPLIVIAGGGAQATCTTSSLSVGVTKTSAAYSGDACYGSSIGKQVVRAHTYRLRLASRR